LLFLPAKVNYFIYKWGAKGRDNQNDTVLIEERGGMTPLWAKREKLWNSPKRFAYSGV
jgi:hypothetical protein